MANKWLTENIAVRLNRLKHLLRAIRSDEGLMLETSAKRQLLISLRWPIYLINSVDVYLNFRVVLQFTTARTGTNCDDILL